MGLKQAAATWYVTRWIKRGAQGKEGEQVKNVLSVIGRPGTRTAVVFGVLTVEAVCKWAGFETGPVFGILHGAFGALGFSETDAIATIGIDPAQLIVYGVGIYTAAKRVLSEAKKQETPAKPVA